jgi:hypothetical protein
MFFVFLLPWYTVFFYYKLFIIGFHSVFSVAGPFSDIIVFPLNTSLVFIQFTGTMNTDLGKKMEHHSTSLWRQSAGSRPPADRRRSKTLQGRRRGTCETDTQGHQLWKKAEIESELLPLKSWQLLSSKACDIRTWKKKHLFLDISPTNTDTLVPSQYQCVETSSTEVFWVSSRPLPHLQLQCLHQRNVCHPAVNRFTRQTFPTVKRKHFFMNILCIESFCPQKNARQNAALR